MRKTGRALLLPAVAIASFGAWLWSVRSTVVDVVPVRDEMFLTNPYAILAMAAFAASLAIASLRPTWSLALIAATVLFQLLFWPMRFGNLAWTGYLVLVPVPALVAYGAEVRGRTLGKIAVAAITVSIAALLSVPALSVSGAWGMMSGQPWPDSLPSFAAAALTCAAIAAAGWFAGLKLLRVKNGPVKRSQPLGASSELLATLSPREREMFLQVAEGRSNAEIATSAFITEATVKTHVSSILTKLSLNSRSELIAYAWSNELIKR